MPKFPKFSLASLRQLTYTLKEVAKIAISVDKRLFFAVIILNAIWGFSAVPGFYLEKLFLDQLIAGIGAEDLNPIILSVGFILLIKIVLELMRSLMSRISNFLRRNLSQKFDAELDAMISQKLATLDIGTIEDPDFRDKFTKIQRESGRRAWGLMAPLSDIPNYLVGFISSVSILILLHPLVAVGVFLISIPEFLIDSRFIKKEYKLQEKLAPLHKRWGWLTYYLIRNRNFMEVKLLNLQLFLTKQLRSVQKESLDLEFELRKKRTISNFGSTLALNAFELIISIWMITKVLTREITIGSFQFYLRSFHSAQNNLSSLVYSFLEVYENYIYVKDLVWFLNLVPVISENSEGEEIRDPEFSIEFRDVWFRYREEQPWTLKGMSFRIRPRENIALVGLNGAGKSTVIKLLARFYDPQRGEILVNGKNLKEYDLQKWRSHLAILFQEFETYPFSVKESVGFGDIERLNDLEDIKEAVEKTGMRKFVERLPKKYSNPLDPQFEKGVRPSIGQTQRFGISRMLFRKHANVLVLDEPTSNVDPEAEEQIFNELISVSTNKILLFVTQRFSTVRLADRILLIGKGVILEEGTHAALMKKSGKYAKLFDLQARGYK